MADVLADESKVLALALGGLARAWLADRDAEVILTGFDEKDGAIGEMNTEVLPFCGGQMGDLASCELPGQDFGLSSVCHGSV